MGRRFVEKLHFSYDPKYGEHVGTSRWMQWTQVIISSLNTFWCVISSWHICTFIRVKGLAAVTK